MSEAKTDNGRTTVPSAPAEAVADVGRVAKSPSGGSIPSEHASDTGGPEFGRPRAQGKFLFVNGEKFFVKGVTYGTFRPDAEGAEFHDRSQVERDFAAMAAHGVNAVRVYTVPPLWLLDLAACYGLRVMVGLAWEQHVAFLDRSRQAARIVERIRSAVRSCERHRAILCYVIGNEIPSSIVRWHGPRKIQRFLKKLYDAAKQEDPEGLVTYVNFPTTEYLQLPFADLYCFNVYLEARDRLEAYLARLQNLAQDRPLLLAEVGLDSRRNGVETQAETLAWQIATGFSSGAAGIFVYAWTDEWHRGGHDIEDWDFGLTDRDRRPKPALTSVTRAFAQAPFAREIVWPRISVVVCSLNGSKTIGQTLDALSRLDYPDYEVIVINDGSTDDTGTIAGRFDVRLTTVQNGGLSRARNLGYQASTGEIVAYIDDDAFPDVHWLKYLAHTFQNTDFAAVGGPNIPPPCDGWIAECVANSPGGPIHVLVSDVEAEHIPGCNMAYRRRWLEDLGGFDPQFRAAGDDVDFCWRLMEAGGRIGFNAAAVVWHHRRNSVRAFWKQQVGYGRAEALLERKWPEKYNSLGHASWVGRIYSDGVLSATGLSRSRIYYGFWGLAPFQGVYQARPETWGALTQTPEWFLLTGLLILLSAYGLLWPPLMLVWPVTALAILAPLPQVLISVGRVIYPSRPQRRRDRVPLRIVTAMLHVMQPSARLWGRLKNGLTPWRACGTPDRLRLRSRYCQIWSEEWRSSGAWLESLEAGLREQRAIVTRGGDFDRWDLEVRGGLMASARLLMGIEEHGAGKQLVRLQSWPRLSRLTVFALTPFLLASAAAATDGAVLVSLACGGFALLFGLRAAIESQIAMHSVRAAIESASRPRPNVEAQKTDERWMSGPEMKVLEGSRARSTLRALIPPRQSEAEL